MKLIVAIVVALSSFPVTARTSSATPEPTEHSFVLHNFRTQSGVVLPEAKIVYGTYGHSNEAKDNAVLLPSHLFL
jgi:homoserine O-acetyltransferase/O-succinyltransferase